jgi:hypothetical protein
MRPDAREVPIMASRNIPIRFRFVVFLIVLMSTALLPGTVVEPFAEQIADAGIELLADVTLDSSTNWPVVEVRVNGRGPFLFIVDTGAAGTVVRDSLTRELELPVVGRSMVGSPASPNGIPVEMVEIESLAIGAGWSQPAQAVSIDRENLPIPHEEIVGILGFPLFRDLLVTFDYPAGKFRIERGILPEPDGEGILPMKPSPVGRPFPAIDILVGTVPVHVTIDSGNSRSLTLPSEFADRLPLESPPEKAPSAQLVGAVLEFRKAVLDGPVTIGATAVEHPTLYFTDRDGPNLGYEILRNYAITFDQAAGRVRFLQASPRAEENRLALTGLTPPKRYGMRFYGLSSDTLEIVDIDPGSPAEAAGLKKGDMIVGLNGTPVQALDSKERLAALRSTPLTLSYRRGEERREVVMSLDE